MDSSEELLINQDINTEKSYSSMVRDLFLSILVTFFFPYIAYISACYLGFIIGYAEYSLLWDIMHHSIQMLLALFVMLLCFRKKTLKDWGFNLNEKEWTLKTLKKFTLGYIVFLFIGKLIYQLLLGWPPTINFQLAPDTIIGILIFRFTLVGLSEEILFRALAIGILMRSWKGYLKPNTLNIPIAGIIAAILFSLAHIGFSTWPFQITYFDPMQVSFAFIFGIFYAILLDKTGSLLGPVLAHNIIDGFGTIIDIILMIIAPI